MRPDPSPHRRRSIGIRRCLGFAVAVGLSALGQTASGLDGAWAGGDARSLTIFHTHTKETATVTFWRDGRFDEAGLQQLNWLLRDWRVGETAKMDPELYNVLWEIYRETGSREPISIISAYRSPATNAMLRNRSKGVSEHSQHMLGKAMDIRLPDVDSARLRAIAMRMQYGGVGYYSSSNFVHVDVGNVRAWPRMSQDQLARLFPDGKTVHLPPNGKPLARYAEAKAEILARRQALASAGGGGPSLRGLLGGLFRKAPPTAGDNSLPEAAIALVAPSRDGRIAERAPQATPLPPPRPVMLAYVPEAVVPMGNGGTGTVERSPVQPDHESLTPESRLLFSSVSVRADRNQPASKAAGGSGAGWLDRDLLLVAANAPIVAEAFSKPALTTAVTHRFTGPAVRQLPVWRVARWSL